MPRARRIGSALLALAMSLNLAACESFDIGDLLPDPKKKIPGERKEVFPGGVPGVTQGVPPELMKGNVSTEDPGAAALQQVREAEERRAAEQKAAEEQAKQKQRPRRTAAPKPAPQPEPEAAPQPQQAQQARPAASPWPSSNTQQAGQSAWPAPPQPGTFAR